MTEKPVGYAPTPETCKRIETQYRELLSVLAEATEDIFRQLPPDVTERDLRPMIYKIQVFDLITNLTRTTQYIHSEYLRSVGVLP